MKTQTKSTDQKEKKVNQLVFIEYTRQTNDGHFITVTDSYHNIIGRVYKNFNEQTKKFEYTALDHAGHQYSKGEKLWEVKGEFTKNKEQLLEQAHQRRIESKEKSKEVSEEKSQKAEQINKTDDRKNQIEKMRQEKTGIERQNEKALPDSGKKSNEKSKETESRVLEENLQEEREQQLDDIRNDRDDNRGEMNLER